MVYVFVSKMIYFYILKDMYDKKKQKLKSKKKH